MTPNRTLRHSRWLWIVVFLVCGMPLIAELFAIVDGSVGPDPEKQLLHWSGESSLILLLATLAVSPLRSLTGFAAFIRFRRHIGLWAFFYAVIHVWTFWFYFLQKDVSRLAIEVVERPYILAGMLAFSILVVLACTSTNGMRRKLARRWVVIHRGVYLAGVLALIHLFWQLRSDAGEALLFAFVFLLLMLARMKRVRAGLERFAQTGLRGR